MSWFWKLSLVVLFLYGAGAIALYMAQRRMMFSPDPLRVLPSAVDLPGLHEVTLKTEEGHALYCWHLPAAPLKPTILFFHGNGGNVANREEKFRQLHEAGYGVFMMGYRGFGGSEGRPSEAALVKDAALGYDYLTSLGLTSDRIVIYGESIGTSIAVQIAVDHPSAALILEAPMYSVLSIAEARYPYVPVKYFLKDKFETNLYIRQINRPLLVVHGSDDGVIPLASGRRLFEAASEPCHFVVLEGAGHNDLYDYAIVDAIVKFLGAHAIDKAVELTNG